MKIVLDFDGTCLTHSFPEIGKDIGALPILRRLLEAGHDIILYTMRSRLQEFQDSDGKETNVLEVAIQWFEDNDIPLSGINETRTQRSWTDSPKPYGDYYIDDRALGCPLKTDLTISEFPFVDWVEIEKILIEKKVIKLTYEQWLTLNEDDLYILFSETGADRELDFDVEKEFEIRYENYLLTNTNNKL